jgi:hypothetical protein
MPEFCASNVRQMHVKFEAKLRYSRVKVSSSTRQMSVYSSGKDVVKIPGKSSVKASVKCAALSRQKWEALRRINAENCASQSRQSRGKMAV